MEHFMIVGRIVVRVVAYHLPQLCDTIIHNGLAPLARQGMLNNLALIRLPHLTIEWYEIVFKVNPLLSISPMIDFMIGGVVVVAKCFLKP